MFPHKTKFAAFGVLCAALTGAAHAQDAPAPNPIEKIEVPAPSLVAVNRVQLQVQVWRLTGEVLKGEAYNNSELARLATRKKQEPKGVFSIVQAPGLAALENEAHIESLSLQPIAGRRFEFVGPTLRLNEPEHRQSWIRNFGREKDAPFPSIRNFFDPDHGAVPMMPELRTTRIGEMPPNYAFRLEQYPGTARATPFRLQAVWPPSLDVSERVELPRGSVFVMPFLAEPIRVNHSEINPYTNKDFSRLFSEFAHRRVEQFLVIRAL